MRSIVVQSVLAAIGVASSQVPCIDTLELRSLQVEKQTLRNSASLGSWNASSLTVFDGNSLRIASPIAPPPDYDPLGEAVTADADHFTRIVSDACSNSGRSPVEFWQVTDTFRFDGSRSSIAMARLVKDTIPVTRRVGEYVQEAGQPVELKFHWTSDWFDLAMLDANDTVDAWSIWFVGKSFHRDGVVGFPVADTRTYRMFRSKVDNPLAAALANFQASVDSIGKGIVDSTRFEVVRMRHVYKRPAWVGVGKSASRQALRTIPFEGGWMFSLPGAASIEILSPDGEVVRRLQGEREVFWDGTDARGRPLRSGIWLARVTGIGSLSLLVR